MPRTEGYQGQLPEAKSTRMESRITSRRLDFLGVAPAPGMACGLHAAYINFPDVLRPYISNVLDGVMADVPTVILDVAREIRRYLEAHPNASDTVEGVQTWWLSNRVPRLTVQKALDALEEDKVVHRRELPDGNHIYAAGRTRPDDKANS
jgi:hypothetical protein